MYCGSILVLVTYFLVLSWGSKSDDTPLLVIRFRVLWTQDQSRDDELIKLWNPFHIGEGSEDKVYTFYFQLDVPGKSRDLYGARCVTRYVRRLPSTTVSSLHWQSIFLRWTEYKHRGTTLKPTDTSTLVCVDGLVSMSRKIERGKRTKTESDVGDES